MALFCYIVSMTIAQRCMSV